MADNVWTFLCRKIIIDRDSLVASAIEVLEAVIVEEDAAISEGDVIPFPMQFYSWWVRSEWSTPESTILRLRIILPNSKQIDVKPDEVDSVEFPLTLEKTTGIKMRMALGGFPWAGFGIYWYLLQERVDQETWRTAARIPLDVREAAKS